MSLKVIFLTGIALAMLAPGWCQESGQKAWVYFSEKAPASLNKNEISRVPALSARALGRRQKCGRNALLDWHDLPVQSEWVQKIEETGARVVVVSRWLNAVSAWVTPLQRTQIAGFSFVKKITPVVLFRRDRLKDPISPPDPLPKPQTHTYDYGASLTQNQLIRVPEVHDLGITGQGVAILMLDTGFNYQEHEAFSRLKVIEEYDFIFNDNVTRNDPSVDRSSQHNHGTQTLSTIGAFFPGYLIGPAFDADFFLAKTENVADETQIEEDYWVAGLEWGERMGADVASSSLGYTDWYEYEDYDGNTAVTTVAADIATQKGMVVVNSMGNMGQITGSIIAPADGDSVIAVGAVTSENKIASFSSIGPTWDLRIKPDVMAMGVSVTVVSANSVSALTSSQGTSFSCPLAAGVAALILSAHPELTPMQVRDALRETADQATAPNNEYGWGTIDALAAVLYHGLVFSNRPEIETEANGEYTISIKVISNDRIPDGRVFIHFRQADSSFDSRVMLAAGENKYEIRLNENELSQTPEFYFSAIDETGDSRTHPYNAPAALFSLEGKTVVVPNLPQAFRLLPNFPNPFQTETTIQYQIPEASFVELSIYSLQQNLVRQLVAENQSAGIHAVIWDGRDSDGKSAPDGPYLVILECNGAVITRKVELVQQCQLSQNFPNPFNQATVIRYQLPNAGRVVLKIYNTLGQEVIVLADEFQPAGRYQLRWEGKNEQQKSVPGGIYFYVLNFDGMYNIKKLTLLR